MKSGGLILRNAIAIFEMNKTSWPMGKHLMRRFGEAFTGPLIPFGVMFEYHTISARDQSKLHQLGKKALPGIFSSDMHQASTQNYAEKQLSCAAAAAFFAMQL